MLWRAKNKIVDCTQTVDHFGFRSLAPPNDVIPHIDGGPLNCEAGGSSRVGCMDVHCYIQSVAWYTTRLTLELTASWAAEYEAGYFGGVLCWSTIHTQSLRTEQ